MRKFLLAACVAVVGLAVQPTAVVAADLPKCRNVAGYEPKATCLARNQRAQWQAEYTAKVTAQLMAQVMAEQAAAERANQKDFMDTAKGIVDGFVSTVKGLF